MNETLSNHAAAEREFCGPGGRSPGRTSRSESSHCEAGGFAVRGGKGRSARPARSQCEAEEVAVRVRRGRSASPKRSQCEPLGLALRLDSGRTALTQCDPAASHCGRAVRRECFAVRPAWVGATAWVGARTLPTTPTRTQFLRLVLSRLRYVRCVLRVRGK